MSATIVTGTVHKYGSNVDTDVIIPARYLNISDTQELTRHCMEDIDPDFMNRISPGDIIVAEDNFGCGSSREHAPLVIKTAGISCVIANTFARIFYRNAINIGLAILESPEAVNAIQNGDQISVDFRAGVIQNLTKKETYHAEPFPPFIQDIIDQNGLLSAIKQQ